MWLEPDAIAATDVRRWTCDGFGCWLPHIQTVPSARRRGRAQGESSARAGLPLARRRR